VARVRVRQNRHNQRCERKLIPKNRGRNRICLFTSDAFEEVA
jgi:hypothetical protein